MVTAGLADCLDFLESFSFDRDDLVYLADVGKSPSETLDAFKRLRFTGEAWAIPEGHVVYAGEPLLEVTVPIAEPQLVETVLLNHMTFQTSVATKAARCVLAADGAGLIDFAFRRTQGIDAAMAGGASLAAPGFRHLCSRRNQPPPSHAGGRWSWWSGSHGTGLPGWPHPGLQG
ncbi:hypothetical protein [Nonomuraea sp. NPDC049784]|uniref:hypothetical protein n=1 Tax=Nonomuraea sp. NPDC049784 TaxID=3154361 RepID=UPI003408858D